MRLILASTSPRRRELLAQLGLAFDVVPSQVDERDPYAGEEAEGYALYLARLKAAEVATSRAAGDVVIGADTVVWLGSRILNKPRDTTEAVEMLRFLRGRVHAVTTAVAVRCGGKALDGMATARVAMRSYSDEEIQRYVAGGEPMDKAGAYAVQGEGGALVEHVEGCYRAVIGLPLCVTAALLSRCGMDWASPLIGLCPHCPAEP